MPTFPEVPLFPAGYAGHLQTRDFDEMAALPAEWKQEYRQVETGIFSGSLTIAHTARTQLGHVIYGRGISVDGLVFTVGIGEHSAEVRARILQACAWLGVSIDADANTRGDPRISAEGSAVSAWVIPTNEELMIARHTYLRVAGKDVRHAG